MKVRFLTDCEIEVIESLDAVTDDVESTTELFNIGDEAEFDLLDPPLGIDKHWRLVRSIRLLSVWECLVRLHENNREDVVNVQFGDGSVAFGLSREWFEEIA